MKKFIRKLICATALTFAVVAVFAMPITVNATDLPIDIDAIRTQDNTDQRITPHFSTDLFTEDSQRASEAVVAQFARRQETSVYLFSAVPYEDEVNIREHIVTTTNNLALFSVPTNYSHVNIPTSDVALSNGTIALTIAICAVIGFIFAMALRKKRQVEDVC